MTWLCARLYGPPGGTAPGGTGLGSGAGILMTATYQTRISGYAGVDRRSRDAALSAYGELYGRMGTCSPPWRRAGPPRP